MPDIWVPMDSGVIIATLDDKGAVTVTDQIAMKRRPIEIAYGFTHDEKEDDEDG